MYKKVFVIAMSFIVFLGGGLTIWAQSSNNARDKIERKLTLGSVGRDVEVLQRLLGSDMTIYPEGLITGFFGNLTKKAVQVLQERIGLEPIGSVGPKTLAFFDNILAGPTPSLLFAAVGGSSSVLNAPTSLTASAVPNQSVQLGWYDTNTNESGYKIERSQSALINFVTVATTGINAASYTDAGLAFSTTYYYRVRAFKKSGNKITYSSYSNTASVTTDNPDITAPTVPTGVSAIASSCSQTSVSWNASTDIGGSGLQGYNVYRNGGLFTTIFAPSTSVADSGLMASIMYSYTVSAFDQAGNNSLESTSTSVITPVCSPLPPPSSGAIITILRVDTNNALLSTSSYAWYDSATPMVANPAQFNAVPIGIGRQTIHVSDIAGYTKKFGVCIYQAGTPECTVSSYPLTLYCDGSSCFTNADVIDNQVTKAVIQYIPTAPLPSTPPPPNTSGFHLGIVINQLGKSLTIIDTITLQVVRTVLLPSNPIDAAMTKNGNYAYITTSSIWGNPSTVYKVDLSSFSVKALTFPSIIGSYYGEIEVSPNDQYVVVQNAYQGTVHFVRVADDSIAKTFTFCPTCGGSTGTNMGVAVTFSPDSTTAYVNTGSPNQLVEIRLSDLSITRTFPSNTNGGDVKIDSTGRFIYTVTRNSVRQYDLSIGTYRDIIAPTNVYYADVGILPDGRIALGDTYYDSASPIILVDPITLAQTPLVSSLPSHRYFRYEAAKNRLWVICSASGFADVCGPGAYEVFDMATNSLVRATSDLIQFGFPSFSQDGRYFFMNVENNNRIIAVDTTSFATTYIPTGNFPQGIFMQGDNRTKERAD